MIPYLHPEFVRALQRQDRAASGSQQPAPETSAEEPQPNHHGAAESLREIAHYKLISIAVAAVKRWFT